jgi:hypothetical protein
MLNTKIFDVPMEIGLELMTIVCSDLTNSEREFFNNVINKVDGVGLRVIFVGFQSANTSCRIRETIASDILMSWYRCKYQTIHISSR